MNKDIMKYVLIGGGLYALYWYVTNYGPSGAVTNAAGAKVAASYWDTWFGGAVAAASTTTTGSSAGAGSGASAGAGAGAGAGSSSTTGPLSSAAQGLLTAANLPPTSMLTVSQWNWYFSKVSGIPQDAVSLGDSGQPMTVTDYLNLRAAKGYTTPQSGNSGGGAGAGAGAGAGNSSPSLATPAQIAQITAVLQPSDVPQFQAMVAAGLTFAQAASMIANANACANQAADMNAARIAAGPMGGSFPTFTFRPVNGGSCVGSGPTLDPLPPPPTGVGALTTVPAARASTAPPSRSPWGRIAAVDAGGMGWKN
jgi:hypothetical protein